MFHKHIIFTLLSVFATVLCADKELCDFNDEDCVTNANKLLMKSVIAGNELWGLAGLEPIHMDTININLSNNMNYIFTDVNLYGMTDCDALKLKFENDVSWYFYLVCPHLILKANYIEEALVDSVPIEGEGKVVITYDNYHIITKGEVETITAGDGKEHMNITNYKIDQLDVKDNILYEFTVVSTNNLEKSEKAHQYFNDNSKKVNDEIQYEILQQPVDQLFSSINKYLVRVPKFELFYKN